MSAADTLPGLLTASFRGVEFFVPDTRSAAGRRVAEHLFPGMDRAAYDDMGRRPTEVSVEGFMVGDDYVGQAKALEAAFGRAGPGTLVHPWLGAMTVILVDPGEISFSAAEMRVARFSATFRRVGSGRSVLAISTGAGLSAAIGALRLAAAMLASAPGIVVLSRLRLSATQRSYRTVAAAWAAAPLGPASGPVTAAIGSTTPGDPAAFAGPYPADPVAFAVRVAAISTALLSAVPSLAATPAVGSAAGAIARTGLTPSRALAIATGATAGILDASADAPSLADRAMLAASAADALAAVAECAAAADFASRDDAVATRASIAGLAGRVAAELEGLPGFEVAASELSRSVAALGAAACADINEAIGRLPPVLVFVAARDIDAFALANHLYGDRPETVEAGYRSIVERNRPRHPARLPAGRVEALKA